VAINEGEELYMEPRIINYSIELENGLLGDIKKLTDFTPK